MLAWKSTIKRAEPSNDYDVAHVSKAMDQLRNKFGSKFLTSTGDGECRYLPSHGWKQPQQNKAYSKKPSLLWGSTCQLWFGIFHFYLNTDYWWQKVFNRYATHFQPKMELRRAKRESRSDKQKEQANKRHCSKEDQKAKKSSTISKILTNSSAMPTWAPVKYPPLLRIGGKKSKSQPIWWLWWQCPQTQQQESRPWCIEFNWTATYIVQHDNYPIHFKKSNLPRRRNGGGQQYLIPSNSTIHQHWSCYRTLFVVTAMSNPGVPPLWQTCSWAPPSWEDHG